MLDSSFGKRLVVGEVKGLPEFSKSLESRRCLPLRRDDEVCALF